MTMRGRAQTTLALAVCTALTFMGCDRSATSLFAPPATGLVRGIVTSVDGARPPQVTLTLSQGDVTLQTTTDAGGVYSFPAVAVAAWTLELGGLPSNWRLAMGQDARRLVLVVADEIVREDFVLERVP